MKRTLLGLAVGAALVTAAGSANAAVSVSDTFNLSGGVGSYTKTSATALDASPGVSYAITIAAATATGTFVVPGYTFILTNPNMGVNAGDLIGGGESYAAAPTTLWSHNFTYTEAGQFLPVYNFTVSLDLLADRKIRTTLTVTSVGNYLVATAPFPGVISTINIGGSMSATTVPAPATAALPLAGAGLLASRRRRR